MFFETISGLVESEGDCRHYNRYMLTIIRIEHARDAREGLGCVKYNIPTNFSVVLLI
jgi:hypothetical protein